MRNAIALGSGISFGLAVYLYLPLAARNDPPINWGDPRTWNGFWWIVSGRPYHGYVAGLPCRYLPDRLQAWIGLWRQQVGLVGIGLAIVGLGSWIEGRRWCLILATVSIFGAYTLYGLTYDTTDSYVYLLSAHLVTVLWIGAGAWSLYQDLGSRLGNRWGRLIILLPLLVIPIWSVSANYGELDLSQRREAKVWAKDVLGQLPADAMLVTTQDRHTFTMDYVLWVEESRRDIRAIDADLLPYRWYIRVLGYRWPDLAIPAHSSLSRVVEAQLAHRPIYLDAPRPEIEASYVLEPQGVLWRIVMPHADRPN